MLILDMQEGTELEFTAPAPTAAAQSPIPPAPALQLQEHLQPAVQGPDPELVRRTLTRFPD
ncbi:hypothetical protein TspCOW1_28480 [Thiohalobacter sp. COW1]|uniref:Aspartate-semialdehyde dehydrogenase n=1 Tax=Thiohalobacter thiocyanaticus TaxID=585455 RepID=A0A1Z4VUW7_9GAMM|nr:MULTISPECIES: hypothetical protein [Thiohalobacter]BAZ95303.1 aspartate-semialdehyde dehydrogenase [Thiohalobacter thiocyanaticus]BCO32745.1 hypothetical protein TspCOW1_28480 [Thiohalobacter sp. COW1]